MNFDPSIQPRRALDWAPRPTAWWRRSAVAALATASVGLGSLAVAAPVSAAEPEPTSASVTVEVEPASSVSVDITPASDERARSDAASGAADEAGQGAEKEPIDEQVAEEPAAQEPGMAEPAAEEPAADQPAAEQPAAEQPAAEQLAAEQPEPEQPAAEALAAAPTTSAARRSASSTAPETPSPASTPRRAATSPGSAATVAAGTAALAAVDGASLPLAPGAFRVSALFGATGSWASYHTGMDFSAAPGTPVQAVVSGTVVATTAGSWAGTHVAIQAADGSSTLYAHLSGRTVSVGDSIEAGEVLGFVGDTGRAFGDHLHFEYYPAGVTPGDVYGATDPLAYLEGLGLAL